MEKLIWLQAQATALQSRWQAVKDYRAYYAGEHPVYLSARQQEYLGDLLTAAEHTVCLNLCRLIVDILRERLRLVSFASPDETLRLWVADLWNRAKLDIEQVTLYRRALRDGSAFLVVSWDAEANEPILVANRCYDGDTGLVSYADSETGQTRFAIKYWTITDPLSSKFGQRRRTIFLPDRIVRQQEDPRGEYGWSAIPPDEGPALQWWTDTMQPGGRPLGLAAIEFQNPGGVSELEGIIGLQNAINKIMLDLLAAADLTGFQMYVASFPGPAPAPTGETPETTSDDFAVGPGRLLMLYENAAFQAVRAGDLKPLIDTLQTLVSSMGKITRTPQYYLWQSGNWGDDVPSGEALKQMESGLVARANERTVQFGDAWVQAVRVAARLHNAMGRRPTLNTEATLTPIWGATEVRNELLISQIAQNHMALGVPAEVLWQSMLGYTPEQVAEMKRLRAAEQAAGLADLLLTTGQISTTGGGNGNTPVIAGSTFGPAAPTTTGPDRSNVSAT